MVLRSMFVACALVVTATPAAAQLEDVVAEPSRVTPHFQGLVVGMTRASADRHARTMKWQIRDGAQQRYALVDDNYGPLGIRIYSGVDGDVPNDSSLIERFIVASERHTLDDWTTAIEWLESMGRTLSLKYGTPKETIAIDSLRAPSGFALGSDSFLRSQVIDRWRSDDVDVRLMIWRDADHVWGAIDYSLHAFR